MSSLKFCPECNNMLSPTEDKEQKILLYACRYCGHQEKADSDFVYRHEIHDSHYVGVGGWRTQVSEDVATDPTLPRTKDVRCAQCGHGEAVFYRANSERKQGKALFFVCCNPNCGHRWEDF